MIRYYLNGKEIKVLNGATFSIKKDETLDSGGFTLIFSDLKDPIKPMSQIRVEKNGETYEFLVMQDTVSVATKKPVSYQHEVQYIQNTKKFSKIQVRNTQFSQPAQNKLVSAFYCSYQNQGTSLYMHPFNYYGMGSASEENWDKAGVVQPFELSARHKVKNAYFQFSLRHFLNTNSLNEVEQEISPDVEISFDLFNGDSTVKSFSATINNGTNLFCDTSFSRGTYTIKNVRVKRKQSYGTHDVFVVAIKLICEVYYYTLYDILDILRKQIAMEESVAPSTKLNAPYLTLNASYSVETNKYNVYGVFTNPNNLDLNLRYKVSNGADWISEEIGAFESKTLLLTSLENGTITCSCYLTDVSGVINSLLTTRIINVSNEIIAPQLVFEQSGNGYKWQAKNINNFECYLYYKVWETPNAEPEEWIKVETPLNKDEYFTSDLFTMTKLHVKCQLRKKTDEGLQSEEVEGYKFIPPVSYEYDIYTSDYFGINGEYNLKYTNQFQSNTDFLSAYQMFRYLSDPQSSDYIGGLEDYDFNDLKSTYDGVNAKLYAYHELKLVRPKVVMSTEQVASGAYAVYATFTNFNVVPCKIAYTAKGSVQIPLTTTDEISANNGTKKVLIGSFTATSSGVVEAYCVYESLKSATASDSWVQGGKVIAPYITGEQYGNAYTYRFTITDLNTPSGTLFYRYKLGDNAYSSWEATTTSPRYITLSNDKTTSQTAKIHAYAQVDSDHSEPAIYEQVIEGKPITPPSIDYNEIPDYSMEVIITNLSGDTTTNAKTYYRITRNGLIGSWENFIGSSRTFILTNNNPGSTARYNIETYTKIEGKGESTTTTTSFNITGPSVIEPTEENCPCEVWIEPNSVTFTTGHANLRIKNGTNISRTITIISARSYQTEWSLANSSGGVAPDKYFETWSTKPISISDFNFDTIIEYKVDDNEFTYRFQNSRKEQ
jgi:hypothetical protein